MIIETDRLEQEMEAGSTYRDIFRKINIRRTEIATGVYAIQVLSGIYLIGYGMNLSSILRQCSGIAAAFVSSF